VANPPHEAHGIVVYLDVLGTRRSGVPESALEHAQRLSRLREYEITVGQPTEDGLSLAIGVILSLLAGKNLFFQQKTDQFSDSIFGWVEVNKDVELALSQVIDWSTHVFHFALRQGLLLRGAIAIGSVVRGDGILVGEAANEAYEWESIADWGGIVLAPTACLEARKFRRDNDQGGWARWTLAQYDVPMKPPYGQLGRHALVVAWPLFGPEELRDRLQRAFGSGPVPAEVSVKHQNTIEFVQWIRGALLLTEHADVNSLLKLSIEESWKEDDTFPHGPRPRNSDSDKGEGNLPPPAGPSAPEPPPDPCEGN
jgi:hypothetical protein